MVKWERMVLNHNGKNSDKGKSPYRLYRVPKKIK